MLISRALANSEINPVIYLPDYFLWNWFLLSEFMDSVWRWTCPLRCVTPTSIPPSPLYPPGPRLGSWYPDVSALQAKEYPWAVKACHSRDLQRTSSFLWTILRGSGKVRPSVRELCSGASCRKTIAAWPQWVMILFPSNIVCILFFIFSLLYSTFSQLSFFLSWKVANMR